MGVGVCQAKRFMAQSGYGQKDGKFVLLDNIHRTAREPSMVPAYSDRTMSRINALGHYPTP